ncbi:MAG: pseudouridine synthase [Bacteroidia bacterium]
MAKKPERNPKKEPFWKNMMEEKKKVVKKRLEKTPLKKQPSARPPRDKDPNAAKTNAAKANVKSVKVNEPIRLNRFIAQAGICSRREADDLIAKGHVKVNGKIATELGLKVDPAKDKIEYKGQLLKAQNFVYILLNKPKNMITTTSDPQGRKTVIDAVEGATTERVFPVGRLDRNTTGLILLTNDGDLAKKLTHPSHRVRKIYYVTLDKPVLEEDMQRLLDGITLEDGEAKVDKIDYAMGQERNEVGVEIHSGKNRIVRRMFEAMGYKVEKLDRTALGSLTKKNLPRGNWRILSESEVAYLRMM